MTTSVSRQYMQDMTQSLIYFLDNETYARSGASSYSTGTLKSFFTGLNIQIGYPDKLDKVQLPTLALVTGNLSDGASEAYGNHVSYFSTNFQIHGFVGKQQSHGHNMLERDKLCQDLKSLLEDQDYITLYQYPEFGTSAGDITVMNVMASYIPPSEEQMDAARYQFIVDLEVEYVKSI